MVMKAIWRTPYTGPDGHYHQWMERWNIIHKVAKWLKQQLKQPSIAMQSSWVQILGHA